MTDLTAEAVAALRALVADIESAAKRQDAVLERIGCWPETLDAVAGVLADGTLSLEERAEFERVVTAIARRWRGR